MGVGGDFRIQGARGQLFELAGGFEQVKARRYRGLEREPAQDVLAKGVKRGGPQGRNGIEHGFVQVARPRQRCGVRWRTQCRKLGPQPLFVHASHVEEPLHDALMNFTRGLAGKGDAQYGTWTAVGEQQSDNAVAEKVGFAGPGGGVDDDIILGRDGKR